jgi:hypothetical protein
MTAIAIRLRFVRRRNHALFMLGHAAAHFLLPRVCFVNLLCGLSQRSSIPSCAANASRSKSIAAVVIRELNCFRGIAHIARGREEISRGNAGVAQSFEFQHVESRTVEFMTGKINPILTCCQSCIVRVPFNMARFCYPEPCNWFLNSGCALVT